MPYCPLPWWLRSGSATVDTMPLTLPEPPDLGPDFWDDPEIVAAIEAGRLDLFLLAYRGARKPRWPQDQVAKWMGCCQATVSVIESGRAHPPFGQVDVILRSLRVPPRVAQCWGTRET
jgi:hypothetical protein